MLAERITTMQQNGGPPEAAATLYLGEVMHARLNPFGHRFVYSVFSLLIDIDRIAEAGRISWLFSTNKRNLTSFWESDHVAVPGQTLREQVNALLAEAEVETDGTRVLLMCYPRLFGYVFNPISVYFVYDADGALTALIYAVRNTFGERHTYVAKLLDGELGPGGVRQERTKIFHVSPFIDMGARYHFRVLPPGKIVRLRIHETQDDKPLLSATFLGEAQKLADWTLLKCLLKFPLMTWKIMAGIHWEALKLWSKGATFHKSPPPPVAASFRDERA